jgi:hypothetical protein
MEKPLPFGLSWREEGPLCTKYPIMYELCTEKNISVKEFHEKEGLLSFRRWLPYILHSQWETVCETILDTPLCEGEDEWIWKKVKMGNSQSNLYMINWLGMIGQILFLESGKLRSLIKSKSFCGS